MVIIRIEVYFTLLLLATCFGSFYRSHLQDEVLCTIVLLSIDYSIVNCIFYLLKYIVLQPEMALIEGAETCS